MAKTRKVQVLGSIRSSAVYVTVDNDDKASLGASEILELVQNGTVVKFITPEGYVYDLVSTEDDIVAFAQILGAVSSYVLVGVLGDDDKSVFKMDFELVTPYNLLDQLNQVVPTMEYLYNDVKFPTPMYNKTIYPYVFIDFKDAKYYFVRNQTPITVGESHLESENTICYVFEYDSENSSWIEHGTEWAFLDYFSLNPFWSNHNILDVNGEVYLEASEPMLPEVVYSIPQNLTEEQKAQARNNIGAVSIDEIPNGITEDRVNELISAALENIPVAEGMILELHN
jgi:hypothetical protein